MTLSLPEDDTVRGSVYLCQVGTCVSCGSCCGLYNIPNLSRERLHGFLKERTERFTSVPRSIDTILAFEQERIAAEGGHYPIPDFHHCVFVGLIQDQGERIGCLLHPLARGNNGVDWRGLSYYGGAACKHFFCPSYDELPTRFKMIARTALTDWYNYGLIIVEHRLLAALFEMLEDMLGKELATENLNQDGLIALASLLRLKMDWPYRRHDTPLAHNFFSTKATARAELSTPAPVAPPEQIILQELDTDPASLEEALADLRKQMDQAVIALTA